MVQRAGARRAGAAVIAAYLTLLTMPNAHTADIQPSASQLELDNGLQLVWEEDHRQPLVAIEARIRGGLRGEGGYVGTGITHFIEHMLFKGTTSRAPGTIEQEVRRYGGTINAFTSFDTTGVSLFVESRYLKEALEMLADILQHAVFPPEEFNKEREVIVSEIQMNLDDPDRRINHMFWNRHYLEHPYKHPILGYQPLLEKLTVEDLTALYAAQYQPQNVTIACSGDLDAAQFPSLAKQLFAGWPRGVTDPRQQLVPPEPPTVTVKETSADLPVQTAYVLLGFSSVRLSDPELYPLDVLANILGQGRSSRLYETIVRQRKLAHSIAAWNYTPYDSGVFGIQLRADPEQVPAAIDGVLQVVEDIRSKGVTDAELAKAKSMVSADYLFGLQTVEGKAGDLANSMTSTGDPLFSRRYVDKVQRVTREEVQAAAVRFLDSSRMTRAIIRPATAAQTAAAPPVAPGKLPVTKTTLGNGATALIGIDHSLPIAAIAVGFRGGVRVETEETQGLANLTAQLLTKGTKHRTASQIAQEIESLGGSLEPFSGRDGFGLVLQLLSKNLDHGLTLMHELITESTFPEEELAIQRRLILNQLQAQDDEIFNVGGRLLRKTLFTSHPYRFNPLGERATISSMTRAQPVDFAKQWLVPSNTVVAVFGDVDQQAVGERLKRSFGALPAKAAPWPDQLPEPPLTDIREVQRTLEKEQALIMLGFRGSTNTAPDRYAVDVMTAVLSGMAGRLFQAVREEHGLAYTLGAAHAPGWDPGALIVYAATRPNEQAQVLQVMDEELARAVAEGFTEEEVSQAKRYLIGGHRLDLQHLVGLAKRSVLDELYRLGFDAWMTYEDKINAVTVTQVNEAAKRYLTLKQRSQVVISPNGHSHPN